MRTVQRLLGPAAQGRVRGGGVFNAGLGLGARRRPMCMHGPNPTKPWPRGPRLRRTPQFTDGSYVSFANIHKPVYIHIAEWQSSPPGPETDSADLELTAPMHAKYDEYGPTLPISGGRV